MKMKVTFEIDCEVLKNFISKLENQQTPDSVVEDCLKKFSGGDPQPPIEQLIGKLDNKTVGKVVSGVLIPLIQKGVASEAEIERMNEASGKTAREDFNAKPGNYCSNSFNSPYALLIDRQTKEFCDDETPAAYSANYFEINGKFYHHCIRWQEGSRKSIYNWIKIHLKNWFENADEEQRNEREKFIESEFAFL